MVSDAVAVWVPDWAVPPVPEVQVYDVVRVAVPELGADASWKVPVKRTSTHDPAGIVVADTVPDSAVQVVPPCCTVMLLKAIVIDCVVLLQMLTSISNFLPGLAAGLHPVEIVDVVAGLDDAKAGVAAAMVTTGTDQAATRATVRRETKVRALEDNSRSRVSGSAASVRSAPDQCSPRPRRVERLSLIHI